MKKAYESDQERVKKISTRNDRR